MSRWLFASAILEGRSIDVFNNGKMQRDFTFVDDIAEGTVRAMDLVAAANTDFAAIRLIPAAAGLPHRSYNIGNHQPVELNTFIATVESALGKVARKEMLPMSAIYSAISASNRQRRSP